MKLTQAKLVGIWLSGKDDQEIGLLIEKVDESEYEEKWKILTSDSKIEHLWGSRIFEVGKAEIPPSFLFPEIKRMMPPIFMKEIISIQPMSVPSGLMFNLDYDSDDEE